MAKLNLVELQQFMKILTDGYGARMLGNNILTESKIIDMLLKTIKPFLSPKIYSRIHIHKDLESVHRNIDKDILPVEYGGNERSVDDLREDWIATLSSEENQKYVEDVLLARTDERYRQLDKFNEEYLGMPGSFRNLNVD